MNTSRNDSNKKTVKFPHVNKAQEQTGIAVTLLLALKKVWHFLLIDFAKKNELQIRWEPNRCGRNGWKVYDPSTGKTVRFSFEAEMLQWIENYYQ